MIKFDEEFFKGFDVPNFHMTNITLFGIANQLKPIIQKHNTKYRKIVPMGIQILYAIYELVMNHLQLENLLCDLFNMNLFMMSIFLQKYNLLALKEKQC